jgi:subtilisin
MARFVIARKRRGVPEDWTWTEVLDILGPSVTPLHELVAENGENVHILLLEADAEEIWLRRRDLPSWVRLEREIRHLPQGGRPKSAAANKLLVRATADGKPLEGAVVTLLVRQNDREVPHLEGRTNETGEATFFVNPAIVDRLVVSPMTGYWPMAVDRPSEKLTIDCPPIEFIQDGLGWWHHLVGVHKPDVNRGAGIRIGVLDMAPGAHEALAHIQRLGTWRGGCYYPARGSRDAASLHGTHVCGIIGARPGKRGGFWGIAPGADLIAGNVCDDGWANQEDIAYAVRDLIAKHETDLINLSLAAPERSPILLDAIRDAWDSGCLCICAAGNTQDSVQWPAAARSALAVSAVGKRGTAPKGSLSASCLKENKDYEFGDDLFFASFSCFGQEIDCCGPGVGIVSTIPNQQGSAKNYWAVLDGTSMATPIVCAALAVRLSRSRRYREMPRTSARSRRARRVLMDSCRPGRLHAILQGKGIPTVRKSKRGGE